MNSKAPFKHYVCLALLMTLCMGLYGCSSHPEATSPESMNLIKQVYTAVNSKNEQRLGDCELKLKSLIESQKVDQAEAKAFEEIIGLARQGDWERAQSRALQFAEAQVR